MTDHVARTIRVYAHDGISGPFPPGTAGRRLELGSIVQSIDSIQASNSGSIHPAAA